MEPKGSMSAEHHRPVPAEGLGLMQLSFDPSHKPGGLYIYMGLGFRVQGLGFGVLGIYVGPERVLYGLRV